MRAGLSGMCMPALLICTPFEEWWGGGGGGGRATLLFCIMLFPVPCNASEWETMVCHAMPDPRKAVHQDQPSGHPTKAVHNDESRGTSKKGCAQ